MIEKKPKVVFTFVEAGMGHIVPAMGISDAFEKKYGDQCEVVRKYIFSESKNEFVRNYGQYVINDVKKTSGNKFYAWIQYYFSELAKTRITLKFLDRFFKKEKKHLIKEMEDLNADLICSTFYSPSHFAILAKKEKGINPIIATYTPDPIVYSSWDNRGDIFFVNNGDAFRAAIKKGFKKDSIKQIPFILRKEANEIKESKEEMRKKLGLPVDNFTILLADGAYGLANLKKYTEALIKLDIPLTVVSVCGKNEQLLKHFESIQAEKKPNIFFVPLGFISNVMEYNRASDLFVGKSGANALVESFFFGVPAVVSGFSNILERRIYKYYIKKMKCGLGIFNVNKFIKFIKRVSQNPEELNAFKNNLKPLQDASGAEKAADILFEKLKNK